MTQRTWLITGVSSGFGRALSEQLLDNGDRVLGTVRDTSKVSDLVESYPQPFAPSSWTSPTPWRSTRSWIARSSGWAASM